MISSIASLVTTSMPSITLPKTLSGTPPSGVCTNEMKNWLPLAFGSPVAGSCTGYMLTVPVTTWLAVAVGSAGRV